MPTRTRKTRQDVFDKTTEVAKEAAEMVGGSFSGGTKTALGTTLGTYTPGTKLTDRQNSGGSTPQPDMPDTGDQSTGGDSKEKKARDIKYDFSEYDEEQRREEMIRQNRAQIDAIDDVYDRQVQQEREFGERQEARANTISAMTGMAGAPEATTRAGNVNRNTQDRINVVNEKRALALARLYGEIDDNIMREKEAHRQQLRENADAYMDEVANKAMGALNEFAAQGVSWSQLQDSDPETLETLVRQSGRNPFELRVMYEQSLPREERPEPIFEGFRGDNFVRILQNPDGTTDYQTYSAAQLGIPRDVEVETVKLGDGVYWYDRNDPLNEDGTPNLVRVGQNPSKMGGSGGTGGGQGSGEAQRVQDEQGQVLPFDDWKRTDAAKELLDREMDRQMAEDGTAAMTTYMADQFLRPIYDESVAQWKRENADPDRNYTASTIPEFVKADLLADIERQNVTLGDLYDAYPDVSSSYIRSLYRSIQSEREDRVEAQEETTEDDEEMSMDEFQAWLEGN